MARDSQYEALLCKYNISIAKARDLQEQMQTKELAWKETEKRYKLIDKLCRELCESILAKDPNEMVLGQEYSWSKVETTKLILKSQNSFKNYNKSRTELLNKVLDESERRRQQIESLEDQISQFFAGEKEGAYKNADDLREAVEKRKVEKQAKQKAPNVVQKAEKDQGVQLICEEEDDLVEGENEAIQDLIRTNQSVKIIPTSTPVQNSQRKKEKVLKARREEAMAHMVDLVEYEQRIDEIGWCIIQAIGQLGISRYPKIEEYVLSLHPECRNTKIRSLTNELWKMDVLYQEQIGLPMLPKIFIYSLGNIGKRLYQKRFGSDPVDGEREKVIAEHDNVEHGYGILTIAEMLQEGGAYQEVSAFNRQHPIKFPDGRSYIPDIRCKAGKRIDYMEYERGTHTQSDFSAKCSKMARATRQMNFITPNRESMDKVKKQIDVWLRNRGKDGVKGIEQIRLTTTIALKGKDPKENEPWRIIYQPKESLTPIKYPGQEEV